MNTERTVMHHYFEISPRFWGVLAFGLACIAAAGFYPAERPHPLSPEVLAALVACVLTAVALGVGAYLGRLRAPALLDIPAAETVRLTALHGVMIAVAGVLLAFVTEAGSDFTGLSWIDTASHHVQFVAWVAALLLLAYGVRGLTVTPASSDPRLRVERWEWLVLVLIVLLALALRVWRLDDTIRMMVDEMNFAASVRWFWAFDDVPLLEPISNVIPFPRLYTYWQSWTMALFGRDFLGFRMVSAITGTLTVAATWWLARHLFDRRAALLAALLLAVLPPHIHFSRLALNNIAEPLFGTLALAYIARGLQSGARRDFVLAGVSLGLTQYFFEAGRWLYPPLVALWLLWVWGVDRRRLSIAMRRHLLAMLGIALLLALPVYAVLVADAGHIAGRMESSGVSSEFIVGLFTGESDREMFVANALYAFLTYVNKPEIYIFYGGVQSLITTPVVPLFVLGLATLVLRCLTRRGVGAMLVLLWIASTSAGNALMVQPYSSPRFVVAFPALAIMMAVGLWMLGRLLAAPGIGRRVGWFGSAVVLALLCGGQVAYYFGPHLAHFNRQFREVRNYRDVEDALLRGVELPTGTAIHLITSVPFHTLYSRDFVLFFSDNQTVETIHMNALPDDYFTELDPSLPHAVFIPPGQGRLRYLMAAGFGALPAPQPSPNPDVPSDEQFLLYYFPPADGRPAAPPVHEVQTNPAAYNRELARLALGAIVLVMGAFVLRRTQRAGGVRLFTNG